MIFFDDMRMPDDQRLINSLQWTTLSSCCGQCGERNVCRRHECSMKVFLLKFLLFPFQFDTLLLLFSFVCLVQHSFIKAKKKTEKKIINLYVSCAHGRPINGDVKQQLNVNADASFNHISHFSDSRLSLEANVNGSLSDQMCHTCVKLFSFVTKLAQNVLQHFKRIEFSGSTSCPSILEYVRIFVPNFTKLPWGFPENSVHGWGEKKDRDRQTMHKHCLWRQLSSAQSHQEKQYSILDSS